MTEDFSIHTFENNKVSVGQNSRSHMWPAAHSCALEASDQILQKGVDLQQARDIIGLKIG